MTTREQVFRTPTRSEHGLQEAWLELPRCVLTRFGSPGSAHTGEHSRGRETSRPRGGILDLSRCWEVRKSDRLWLFLHFLFVSRCPQATWPNPTTSAACFPFGANQPSECWSVNGSVARVQIPVSRSAALQTKEGSDSGFCNDHLEQAWANYGPRTISGLLKLLNPATPNLKKWYWESVSHHPSILEATVAPPVKQSAHPGPGGGVRCF